MKRAQELIAQHCRNNNIDISRGLNELLDYLIEFFDIEAFNNGEDGVERHYNQMLEKSRPLFMVCVDWLARVSEEMDKGGWIDYFGELYESMYQSKGKASNLGQFFTPPSLCNVMSKVVCTDDETECKRISDSACGSGRTLLAHFANAQRKDGYYVGEDIDISSVKMCALNMMVHGMHGRVVLHDTLCNPDTYDIGYEVKEVRYPFPTPFYSLRKISKHKK